MLHRMQMFNILAPCCTLDISRYLSLKNAEKTPHSSPINAMRPRQDGRHFADDIFTCIFFNENGFILIKFSLKYVRKGSIDNNPALVQIMTWRRPGDKPLSEPMMVRSLTHICVTRPQWVKGEALGFFCKLVIWPKVWLSSFLFACYIRLWYISNV